NVDVATCTRGRSLGRSFSSDWKAYWSAAQKDPTGTDPTKVQHDLTRISDALTRLAQEDTNPADVQRITASEQGIGHIQTAVQLLHAGNVADFTTEAEQGLSAIQGFGTAKLAICRRV